MITRGFLPSRMHSRLLPRGGMAVVVDDPDRENEGDLVMAAEKVTPQAVNRVYAAERGGGLGDSWLGQCSM